MLGARLASSAALALLVGASAHADQVADDVDRAKEIAKGWKPDARLVYVHLWGYGFKPGTVPPQPDDTPTIVEFYFYAPSANDTVLRIARQAGVTPGEAIRSMGLPHYSSMVPWTVPLPDSFTPAAEAVTLAERSGVEKDCAGTNVNYGCAHVTGASLHMYVVGAGQDLPIWRVDFGQDRQANGVYRLINARSGKVVTNCTVPDRGAAATDRGNLYLECR